ncbi:hypothetical protein [Roseivivax sp. CAU 1753]
MRRWALVLPVLAAACGPEPENAFERELGPPPGPTQTTTSVSISAGSGGVDVGGSISRTRGNLTYGIGF